jgi:hypothetical protein
MRNFVLTAKWQNITCDVDTNGKFTMSVTAISVYLKKDVNTSVIDTGGKFTTGDKNGGSSP